MSLETRRVLAVGDLHAVPDELEDCAAVINLIRTICRQQNITEVWWTGDQHHTHSVLRVEVLHWFKVAFRALKAEGINSVCLVGNHDQASPGSVAHAMMAYQFDPGVCIIDKPTLRHGVLMVPYMHTEAEFVEAVKSFTKRTDPEPSGAWDRPEQVSFPPTLFCHQTFDGSTYENGFLASDGFDPNLVPQELIISGHIHTGQEFGKVWYLGAPRWRTLSDANVERSIWMLEFTNGRLTKRTPFGTGSVCRQIRHAVDSPNKPVALPLEAGPQWRIDIKGPAEWCQSRKLVMKAAGARVRTFPEQVSTQLVARESEGIEQAFQNFLGHYAPKYGTDKNTLAAMAKERLG